MNQKLLNKHVNAALSAISVAELAADGSNANDFFCADVVSDRKFAQNFGGYPRSEIAEINECTNIEMQKLLLSKLTDYRGAADAQNSGKTDAEIMLGHRSKYCQSATEQQSWLEGQIKLSQELRAAKLAELRSKEAAKARYFNELSDKQQEDVKNINVNPE